jgi:nitrogen regulatory protein P-II 1
VYRAARGIEIGAKDGQKERAMRRRKVILAAARTGQIGDGKIFILDLAECVRIRTGERDGVAIG